MQGFYIYIFIYDVQIVVNAIVDTLKTAFPRSEPQSPTEDNEAEVDGGKMTTDKKSKYVCRDEIMLEQIITQTKTSNFLVTNFHPVFAYSVLLTHPFWDTSCI